MKILLLEIIDYKNSKEINRKIEVFLSVESLENYLRIDHSFTQTMLNDLAFHASNDYPYIFEYANSIETWFSLEYREIY